MPLIHMVHLLHGPLGRRGLPSVCPGHWCLCTPSIKAPAPTPARGLGRGCLCAHQAPGPSQVPSHLGAASQAPDPSVSQPGFPGTSADPGGRLTSPGLFLTADRG